MLWRPALAALHAVGPCLKAGRASILGRVADRGKQLVLSGLDHLLSACAVADDELPLARTETLDWARTRAQALRERRGIVSGLGVMIPRSGRAELRSLEVSGPGPGEVMVEMLASAVSIGTERAQWLRLPNARPKLPHAPGYSGAGRVVAIGPGVVDFDVGSLVAVPRARHASVATLRAAGAAAVPEGVRVQDAALAYLGVIAGWGVRRAGAVEGEPVCILGVGSIGALAHRLVMLRAPGPVTVVATSRRREATALAAGASRFLISEGAIADIDASVVIEATGDPDALGSAVAAAAPGATVVLLGSPRGLTRNVPVAAIQRKRLRLVGAHVSTLVGHARRSSVEPLSLIVELSRNFLSALGSGVLETSDLTGDPVDPREIGLLYRRIARSEVTAAHLDWTRLPRDQRFRRRRLVSMPLLPPKVSPVRWSRAATPPAQESLRFAVVGCGDIGFSNARAVSEAANAEVVLCHDSDPALAAAATRFGGEVAPTLEAALDSTRVDAVFLSVPHDLHAPLVVQAARAGLHVVVEKPMANDLIGAQEAAVAAAAADVQLSVCFSFRYEPAVQAARDLVEAGAIGAFRQATLLFRADKPASYWRSGLSGRAVSDWRGSRSRSGGGVLIMNVVHYVDLIRYLTGAEPTWVAGLARSDAGAEVEDRIALAVGFTSGAVGSLSGSASTRGAPPNRFELSGEVGTLVIEPEPAVYTERALEGVTVGRWTPIAQDPAFNSRQAYVERVASSILTGQPPDVTPVDGLVAQAFVDAAYRAVDTGQPVAISAPESHGHE